MFWLFFIALLLLLIIVIYNLIPFAENKVLFFPSKKDHWCPEIDYEEVYINVKNPSVVYRKGVPKKSECDRRHNYIHGWYFNRFPGHKTVLYFHGNSGNISNRSYIVDICEKFELNLFIFDYRGFGKSSGNPSKVGLRQDSEAAYHFVRNTYEIAPDNIVTWGESLGGAAAIWVASKYPCRSLILLSTFSGLDDAARYYCDPGIKQTLVNGCTQLCALRFDMLPSRDYIKKVKCPVVIMHSKDDDIIPYTCAKILYDNVSHKSKILITIKGAHSAPEITKEQLRKLFMFCDISLSKYEKRHDIEEMLDEIRTVAARHHNFID